MTRPVPFGDPLYAPRLALPDDAAAERVTLAGVEVAVVVSDTDPTTLAAQWSPDRQIALALLDDVEADAFGAVLLAFADLARERADGRAAEAAVSLPSRDIDRARVARAAGFAPTAVLAAADLRRPGGSITAVPDIAVRDAVLDDATAVARLWCEQAEYEARVGTLRSSPAIRAAIAEEAAVRVAGPADVLLATVGDDPVGLVIAGTVEESSWTAGRVAAAPARYLDVASTAVGHRGTGVASALVAEIHARYRAGDVAVGLLHYSAYNPLSIPFWSRQGYRPLTTAFARPVRGNRTDADHR